MNAPLLHHVTYYSPLPGCLLLGCGVNIAASTALGMTDTLSAAMEALSTVFSLLSTGEHITDLQRIGMLSFLKHTSKVGSI